MIASAALSATEATSHSIPPEKGSALQHDATVEHRPETPERRELTRGQRVRIARIARGWPQGQLARKANLLTRTVWVVEQDKSDMRDSTIFKLSLALDLNVEELI